MIAEKRELKKLYRAYNKQLKKIHNKNFVNINNNLEYFVTYLAFLRDSFILTESLGDEENENIKISSIATALEEYNQYIQCEHKYFKWNNGKIDQLIQGSKEEILKQYNEEKACHWSSFWQLIALNIDSWVGGTNVTI